MVGIVKAKASLDAEPVVVGGPVPAFNRDNVVVFNLVGQLAADAAIGAYTVDLAVGSVGVDAVGVDQGCRHQGTGWARLHAFAASHTGTITHRVVKVEDDLLVMTTRRHADHVVDLDLAAG